MCGFIAGTKEVLTKHGVKYLLDTQDHRGTDGYGAICITEDGDITHVKSMMPITIVDAIDSLIGNPFIIIHHRATSVGKTKLSLAHPLEVPNSNTILMQNGTNKSPYTMVIPAESDSEALAMLADIMEPSTFAELILQEVGVIFWRKNDELFLFRDDSRPLLVNEEGLIASEPIVTGTWKAIDLGFYKIEYKEGKLTGLDTFGTVVVEDVGDVGYCNTCKKRHYIPTGYSVCHPCVADGTEQRKSSPRGNTLLPSTTYGAPYDYYDEDYELDYWDYIGVKKGKTTSLTDADVIAFRVMSNSNPIYKDVTYEKMYGTPILVGSEIYLIPKSDNNSKSSIGYMVEKVGLTFKDAAYYNGVWLPVGKKEALSNAALYKYWRDDVMAYDLQDEVYYLDPSLLDESDKAILVYNAGLSSYVIPNTYDYGIE